MGADVAQGLVGIGQRQKVVVVYVVVGRPSEVLGNQRRLVARGESREPSQVIRVEVVRAADRHGDTMQRYGVVAAEPRERVMRQTAGAHVVLGVDLEEPRGIHLGEDSAQMLMLETRAGAAGDRKSRKEGRVGQDRSVPRCHRQSLLPSLWRTAYDGRSRSSGSSEPMRSPGSSILVQVPASTYFQELPW